MATPAISKLKGTGYEQVQLPRLSPEQQQLFSQVFGATKAGLPGALSHLSQQAGGGSEDYWKQLEAPALRQFGELQGQLASRFSGMGTGARRSSGFQNVTNTAAQQLAEKLQSNRLGLQQDAIQQLLGLYGDLMGTEQYDTYLQKQAPARWKQILGGAAPIVGGGLGAYFGGPMGASLGSSLGSGLGSALLGDTGSQGKMDFSSMASLPTKWR